MKKEENNERDFKNIKKTFLLSVKYYIICKYFMRGYTN